MHVSTLVVSAPLREKASWRNRKLHPGLALLALLTGEELLDVLRGIEGFIGKDLPHRPNDLRIRAGLLGALNQLVLVDRVGKRAEHLIYLRSHLAKLSVVKIHRYTFLSWNGVLHRYALFGISALPGTSSSCSYSSHRVEIENFNG